MNYLVVVAHPDDEILGAGIAIRKLICAGHRVAVGTMCSSAAARLDLSGDLEQEQNHALRFMGVEKKYSADFPNIQMNAVPHLELVQCVEQWMIDFQADALITHHPSDTNNDHVMVSQAVQAACRLSQRREGFPALKRVLYMEAMSSTEWSLQPAAVRFQPNWFFRAEQEDFDAKLEALAMYRGVMRQQPHPRSKEVLTGLAAFRGSQCGSRYAEAFECVFYAE